MILVSTSVVLLFIPVVKWHNVHRSRNSKHSTVPYGTISWEFSKNYKSKPLWMITTDISLESVAWQDWKNMVSTILTQTGVGGAGCLIFHGFNF